MMDTKEAALPDILGFVLEKNLNWLFGKIVYFVSVYTADRRAKNCK